MMDSSTGSDAPDFHLGDKSKEKNVGHQDCSDTSERSFSSSFSSLDSSDGSFFQTESNAMPACLRHELQFYQALKNDSSVASIAMTRAHLFSRQSRLMKMQTVYSVGYTNGKVQEVSSDKTSVKKTCGLYCSTLQLEVGEYIVQVKPNYRRMTTTAPSGHSTRDSQSCLKQVTFTTQRGRVVTLGGSVNDGDKKGSVVTRRTAPSSSAAQMAVVVLSVQTCSQYANVLGELGYCTEEKAKDEENNQISSFLSQKRPYTLYDRSHHHELSLQSPLTDTQSFLQQPSPSLLGGITPPSLVQPFCDLSFYQHLCQQPDCVRVDLQQIHCCYKPNHSIVGVFGVYRSTFANGSTVESRSIDYHHHTACWIGDNDVQLASLVLQTPQEYVVDLQVRQQRGVLTVLTNLRTVFLGADDSNITASSDDATSSPSSPEHHHQRVVALAGVRKMGRLQRISFVTESRTWEILKPLITVRRLVQQRRAVPSSLQSGDTTLSTSRHQKMIQGLVVALPDDVFGKVLSFLVPPNRNEGTGSI